MCEGIPVGESPEELPDEEDGDAAADAETAAEGFDARPPSAIAWDARGFDLARLRDECSQTETLHSHVRMQLTGVRVGEEDALCSTPLSRTSTTTGTSPAACMRSAPKRGAR